MASLPVHANDDAANRLTAANRPQPQRPSCTGIDEVHHRSRPGPREDRPRSPTPCGLAHKSHLPPKIGVIRLDEVGQCNQPHRSLFLND